MDIIIALLLVALLIVGSRLLENRSHERGLRSQLKASNALLSTAQARAREREEQTRQLVLEYSAEVTKLRRSRNVTERALAEEQASHARTRAVCYEPLNVLLRVTEQHPHAFEAAGGNMQQLVEASYVASQQRPEHPLDAYTS